MPDFPIYAAPRPRVGVRPGQAAPAPADAVVDDAELRRFLGMPGAAPGEGPVPRADPGAAQPGYAAMDPGMVRPPPAVDPGMVLTPPGGYPAGSGMMPVAAPAAPAAPRPPAPGTANVYDPATGQSNVPLNFRVPAATYARPGVYAPAGDVATAGKAGPLGDLDLNDPQVKMLLAMEPAQAPTRPGQDFKLPVRPPAPVGVLAPAGTQAPAGTPATLASFFPDPAKLAANLNAFHQGYAPSYDRAEPEAPAVMETGGGWWRENERAKAEYGAARTASAKTLLDYLNGNTQAASGAADAAYKSGTLGLEQQKFSWETDNRTVQQKAALAQLQNYLAAHPGEMISPDMADTMSRSAGMITGHRAGPPPGPAPAPGVYTGGGADAPATPTASLEGLGLGGELAHQLRYGDQYSRMNEQTRKREGYNVPAMLDAIAAVKGNDWLEQGQNFNQVVTALQSLDPLAKQRLLDSAASGPVGGTVNAISALLAAPVTGLRPGGLNEEAQRSMERFIDTPMSENLGFADKHRARRNQLIRDRLRKKQP